MQRVGQHIGRDALLRSRDAHPHTEPCLGALLLGVYPLNALVSIVHAQRYRDAVLNALESAREVVGIEAARATRG